MRLCTTNVAFSTVHTVGERVYKTGKIFQAGEYPDKNVSVTVENLREGKKKFMPCAINVEHWPSVFDGKLGELVDIEIDDTGAVFGTLVVPKALDELLGGEPVSVSIELRHDDWVIDGLAFAKNPRVPDASVYSMFGLEPPRAKKEPKMGWKEKLKTVFSKVIDEMPDDESEGTPKVEEKPKVEPTATPEFAAEQEKNKRLEAELAKLKSDQAAKDAQFATAKLEEAGRVFATELLNDRRILKSQLDFAQSQYCEAVVNDSKDGAFFTDEGKPVEGASVKALREFFGSQPQHKYTAEQMGKATLGTIPGTHGSAEFTEADRVALLNASSLGRKVLELRGQK